MKEMRNMFISDTVFYAGVNDRKVDLFEGQYPVPNGISYNSYIIKGEKVAVMDSVDKNFGEEWLENIEKVLGDKAPDYLVVLHMEPDHSANIKAFLEKYPDAVVVSSAKAFAMMENYFGKEIAKNRLEVKDGEKLDIGGRSLTFVAAPMVHWPEVMVAYDDKDKILFSADAFGKFGDLDSDEPWDDEARRYYIGIVGKYGAQAQSLLKKAAALDIAKICPLHGEVLDKDLAHYISLYNIWSSYAVEKEGVVIAYASVYGNTAGAAKLLKEKLEAKGVCVALYDLARADRSLVLAEAFRYGKLVLASTTYNGDVFPFMRYFIGDLAEHNYQNRTVAFIENGTWAPMAKKKMADMLAGCKNLTFAENSVKIISAVNEQNINEIENLAEELGK